jgi:hypothetical protein
MWRVDATDVFGIFAGIVLGLGFFALIAYLVYLFVYKRIQMNHEMRLEMIRQGMSLQTERESYGSLKAGIVSTAVGLGLLIAIDVAASADRDPIGGEIVLAVIPLFVGLGLILFHLISRRTAERMKTESYLSESPEP